MSSIRTRLAKHFAVLLLTAVAVFAGIVYAARSAGATAELEAVARERADIALQIVRKGIPQNVDFLELPAVREMLDGIPGYLVVYNDQGARMYSSQPVLELSRFLSSEGESVSQLARDDLDAFEAALARAEQTTDPVPFQLRNDGGILLQRGDAERRRAIAGVSWRENNLWRELLGSALIALPFLVLIAMGGSYLLAGNVLEPVDRIRREVEAITDGRSLHRRVAVESRDDEMMRLTTTLNDMIGRLERSFGALRRFTADASHELKTPLAVLRADVERAMSVPSNATEQLVALEEALQETTRMADLVDSLLTLARADEGRFDLHTEPLDIEAVVRDVMETATILGEVAGVTVTLPMIERLTVNADAPRLRQLFLNLVTNAIKYTPRGGRVQLSLSRQGDHAVFSVRDTGIGISAADLPHVFERFWRADRARSRASERGGFGLGLAISQWIAQAHGGHLTVESRLHRGSTFTVTLPLAPQTDSPDESKPAA